MTLLSVKDLAVARGDLPVLEGVGFALAPGEALVLRGPNGIGKTTLLRTVAGLQPPLAGQVVAAPEAVAYAAHADGVKAVLTVAENLGFWAGVFGQDRVAEALDRMNLRALADRRAANLSAGQKRRLALTRLLIEPRSLWLLDEPTAALDNEGRDLVAELVAEHRASGGMVITAVHGDGFKDSRVLDLSTLKAASTPKAKA